MAASPFPGMDPYLERHWLDVHLSLVGSSRNVLNELLPDDLIARGEERIAVGGDADGGLPPSVYGPDVRVFQINENLSDAYASGAGGTAVLAPYKMTAIVEPVREHYIEVVDSRGGDRLVTVLEVLSPTNKLGAGLTAYLAKRGQLLRAGVNVVEINLVRAGGWWSMAQPADGLPADVQATYCVLVHQSNAAAPARWLQPVRLDEPLPDVNVPLRHDDDPVRLPLQSLVEGAYRNGRYASTLQYNEPLDPPPTREEAATVERLLKATGRR